MYAKIVRSRAAEEIYLRIERTRVETFKKQFSFLPELGMYDLAGCQI